MWRKKEKQSEKGRETDRSKERCRHQKGNGCVRQRKKKTVEINKGTEKNQVKQRQIEKIKWRPD